MGAVDPVFNTIGIITYFEAMIILISIVILELVFKKNLLIYNKYYFILGAIFILIVNSIYFYSKKRYNVIINDVEFISINSKIKTFHVIGAMFFIFLLLAGISLVRKQHLGW
jgi:hypothetical protein